MTRPTRIASYPVRYFDIAQRFENGEKVVSVPCATVQERRALRLDLYAFRRAMEANGMAADYPNFITFRVKMPKESTELVLYHADEWMP